MVTTTFHEFEFVLAGSSWLDKQPNNNNFISDFMGKYVNPMSHALEIFLEVLHVLSFIVRLFDMLDMTILYFLINGSGIP
jgi:hypothetical protein